MRFLITSIALLGLAGCASTPRPAVVPVAAPPAVPPSQRGDLVGLDAAALGARFGAPRLQVREGDGTKLQFAGSTCLLDAYLYPPPAGGAPRVTHVDTRNREGRSVDPAACIRAISR